MNVTVIVITYNSSKYIIETLESIKNQTYRHIQLIISDDCSTDNTREICKEWLNNNSIRFINSHLVVTETNRGICHNYNNGLKYAEGEWIKYIAGDDRLKPNCIEEFIKATQASNDKIFLSQVLSFSDNGFSEVIPKKTYPFNLKQLSKQERVRTQEIYLARKSRYIIGPTIFVQKEVLLNLGGFEEKYPFVEDLPLIMKYLKNGYPIGYVEQPLVMWRIYPDSVSHSDNRFAKSIYKVIDDYCIPAALKYHRFALWYHLILNRCIRLKKVNKPTGYFLRVFDLVNWKRKFVNNETDF